MAKIVGSFKAGDRVPSWLIDCDPSEDQPGVRPSITFLVDCHVVETKLQYVVVAEDLPLTSGRGSYILIADGTNAVVFAVGKTVVLPQTFTMFGRDGGGGHEDDPRPNPMPDVHAS